MFRILCGFCVLRAVVSQDSFSDMDDNIAMETILRETLEDGSNRLSTFLSRAGEFFSDSDFGNKIGYTEKKTKPKIIHPVKVKEVTGGSTMKMKNGNSEESSLRNLTSSLKNDKLGGPPIGSNLVKSFLAGGKDVDDMQDELKTLLFGEEEFIGKPLSNLTQSEIAQPRKGNLALVDGDRANDYDPEDYDQYNYDNLIDANRRMDSELPQPAELRQRRPYRPSRRRPMRGPIRPTGARIDHISNRQSLPPIRAPELHKVPGRVQGLQIDRNVGASRDPFRQNQLNAPGVDCDFYTDDLCLGVREYPRWGIRRTDICINLYPKARNCPSAWSQPAYQ